jgi:protein-disulfide isomerase
MKTVFRFAKWAALPLALMLPLSAQKKKEQPASEGITRQQADDILDELRQIRQLLQQQQARAAAPAPPAAGGELQKANLNLTGAQMMGSKTAPITVVEFTDYQCPFCQRFHTTTFTELKKNYIDTGKIRFYSRDLPLDSIHPNAMRAAQAARCAGDQGKFWQIRDVMGANPDKLDMDHIVGFAGDLKMDTAALRSCVDSGKYKEAVQADVLEAMKIGANGTPAFVVGKSTENGVDGDLMVGALPYVMFQDKLRSLEPAAAPK